LLLPQSLQAKADIFIVMPYMKWLPSTQPAVPCDGLQQQ
jgi:hypothetical protein